MEKGASSWLTVLPLEEHHFSLHKQAFRDALALRYGWQPSQLPAYCSCDQPFSVQHALSCPKGGYPSIRHNELWDFTASLLSETCHGVAVEPSLQPITSERFVHATANTQDGARLDIRLQMDFGVAHSKEHFLMSGYSTLLLSQTVTPLSRQLTVIMRTSRKDTMRKEIREVEHSSFTPLVFSTTGSLGPAAGSFYKRLASMLADKWKQPYSTTMGWLRCRLSFSLLRSSIRCLRGARSSAHKFESHLAAAVDLTVSDSNLKL